MGLLSWLSSSDPAREATVSRVMVENAEVFLDRFDALPADTPAADQWKWLERATNQLDQAAGDRATADVRVALLDRRRAAEDVFRSRLQAQRRLAQIKQIEQAWRSLEGGDPVGFVRGLGAVLASAPGDEVVRGRVAKALSLAVDRFGDEKVGRWVKDARIAREINEAVWQSMSDAARSGEVMRGRRSGLEPLFGRHGNTRVVSGGGPNLGKRKGRR